jgi:hypothetical protein
MTDLQLYLLVAPLALAAFGVAATYVFIRVIDREQPPAR